MTDPTAPSDDLSIDERFTLGERVGRGAGGDVHRAVDRATGRTVAIKRLLPAPDDPVFLERFQREARLLARVESPHVVGYVGHGTDGEGRRCLVVEWLEGEDLARRLRRQRLGVREALDVARQAALGLAALHDAGIVHRDVKPANLFVLTSADGSLRVKLVDLGIARARGDATLTTAGLAIGTPFYMAPEQARGEPHVTEPADQFALGAVLFELLSGKRAFAGDDIFAVLAKIVLQEPPRLTAVLPGAPPVLDALLRRAMAKAPEDRFVSAHDLAAAIAAIAPWDESASEAEPEPEPAPTSHIAALGVISERRVVTAIFAGFSAVKDIGMDGDAQRALESIAVDHGAVCHPTLGRRLIAVFGATRTIGDEVVRAARAALAAAARIPGVRLVIATGSAVSGATGVTGDLIDRGARAMDSGLPDASAGIRVDDATARALADHFAIEGPEGERVLTGALRAAAPPRTLVGRATPCVGRARELASLEAMVAECVSEPIARAVLVTGPAGVGKSRLRYELVARLAQHEAEPLVSLARGSPLAEGSPFGLLSPTLRRLSGIRDGEPPGEQRRKLAERFGPWVPPESVELLGQLVGVPAAPPAAGAAPPRVDAIVSGDRMRAAWLAWLEAECAVRPVVLVLEDLHWGDPASVAFVDAALRALEARPFFVLALARPEVHERFPRLWAGRRTEEMRLGSLTPKAAEQLVRAVLGDRAGAEVVQRIVARGEGNAFYLEELIRDALEGTGDALPESVLGMVQTRLDALGADAKQVLRAASVLGSVFWRGAVAALVGEQAGALGAQLGRLAEAEVISRRADAAFPGEEEYVFRHALVREAAYAMIPEADRGPSHLVAGVWLERAGEVDRGVLAAHFERGGDRARAAGFLVDAAQRALACNDFAGAIAFAERGLALGAGEQRDDRGRARLVQAEARRWRGELAEAVVAATEAADLLAQDSPGWFHAVREAIAANGRLGHVDLVKMWAGEAIACKADGSAAGARIACLAPVFAHLLYGGDTPAAMELLGEVDAIVAASGELDAAASARVHQIHAIAADHAGDLEEALARHEATLVEFERARDLRGACMTRSNLAFAQKSLGRHAEAEESLRRAHAAAERMGLGVMAAHALHNLGAVLAALGRLAEARAAEERAVEAFGAAGDGRLEGASRVYLSRILLAEGDLAGAEDQARRVAEAASTPPPLRAGALAALANAVGGRGRAEEAGAHAAEAAAILASLGAIEDFDTFIGLAHAEALHAVGEEDAARGAIAGARARVLGRATRLGEAARRRFLEEVPDNVRCLELASRWRVEAGSAG